MRLPRASGRGSSAQARKAASSQAKPLITVVSVRHQKTEAEPNTASALFCTSSSFREEEKIAWITGHTGGETSYALRRLETFVTRCLYFQVTGAVSATPQKPQRRSLGWPEYPALALWTATCLPCCARGLGRESGLEMAGPAVEGMASGEALNVYERSRPTAPAKLTELGEKLLGVRPWH